MVPARPFGAVCLGAWLLLCQAGPPGELGRELGVHSGGKKPISVTKVQGELILLTSHRSFTPKYFSDAVPGKLGIIDWDCT